MMSPGQYRLSALGMVCALGSELEEILERALAGDCSGLVQDAEAVPERRVSVAPVTVALPSLPQSLQHFESRNARLIQLAYEQLKSAASESLASIESARLGVVMGSSTSGIERGEPAIREWLAHDMLPPDFRYEQQEMGTPGRLVAALSGARGPAMTLSTACSSSSKVMATARRLLRLGICDAVLVGGADSLCGLTLNGFASLEAMSPSGCRPFARDRDGISIGEGAALFLLTRESGGIQLLGVGESADAHHLSAPLSSGRGAIAAMRSALTEAGLGSTEVSYLNLHGTATLLNDEMECRAVHGVFAKTVPGSSTKALHGHALGAAGAIELGICWLLLRAAGAEMRLPPQAAVESQDPALGVLRLVQPGETVGPGPRGFTCLSSSYAFGGSNCAVLIGREVA